MDSEKKYSDKDLVTAMQAVRGRVKADSDIKAFEQIFHKYYPMLRNFIAGLLKNPAEAEDIAQNCFMKLWFNRCSLNPEQSLKKQRGFQCPPFATPAECSSFHPA